MRVALDFERNTRRTYGQAAARRKVEWRIEPGRLGVDAADVPAHDRCAAVNSHRASGVLASSDNFEVPMDIIPVLDLAAGVAVWARAGDRAQYEPVESELVPSAVGDATALLAAFRNRLGASTCYIADLDAIQGGAVQRTMLRELAELETGFAGAIMVDAGAHTPGSTLEVLACGASQVVVGLETLKAFSDLARIVESVGEPQVVFSVDLRQGSPILHRTMQDATGVQPDALSLAAQAVDTGVGTLLLLDLA